MIDCISVNLDANFSDSFRSTKNYLNDCVDCEKEADQYTELSLKQATR